MKQAAVAQGVTGFPSAVHPDADAHPSATLRLPADLGIEQAADLRRQLLEHGGGDGAVTLDASEVQRIHTAALQLFCMFCRDRRAVGRETHWRQPSEALRSAAALLGATTLLSLGRA